MNNNQNTNLENNDMNTNLNNNLGSIEGTNQDDSQSSQNDYYNNDAYYSNENYSPNNYSDTSYEEPEKKSGVWWKILLGILILLVIIIVLLKSCVGSKTTDEKYTALKAELCAAAESYVEDNPEIIDNTEIGTSVTIKLQKLADANLILEKLDNPYYDGSLFKKSTEDKYYSLDNSVRLTVLTDGTYNCEMVDNSSDVTAPVLTLLGDSTVTIAVGTEFEDPGYTATDDYDGDITSSVVRSGNVDISTAGEYEITYAVSDSAGNTTSITRKIVVEEYNDLDISVGSILDSVTPSISLKGANAYCLVKGTKYVEPGAIATDNVDGDITDRISVTNKITGNLLGSFRVTYEVEDSAGNKAIAYRAVIVATECPDDTDENLTANNAPVITLVGKTSVTITVGTTYLDLGATAYDKEDGDITSKIITDTSNVNTDSAGVYKVYFRVTDSDGTLSTAKRIVTVKEDVNGTPSVRFTSTNSNVNIKVGEGTNALIAAPSAVNENGVAVYVTTKIEDYTTKVSVDSIDWSVVGKYRVTYTATHGNGEIKQTSSIVVNIYTDEVVIGGPDSITVTERSENCNLTEADLLAGGVTFTTSENVTPIVSITADNNIVCALGTYEATVSARTNTSETTTKKITVYVTDGNSEINTSAPSKVVVISNSAYSNDLYNNNENWVGGSVTGITVGLKSTPVAGSEIAYFEWTDDCSGNTADGQITKTGTNTAIYQETVEGSNQICFRAVTTTGIKGPWSNQVNLYIDRTAPTTVFNGDGYGEDDWHNTSSLTINYTSTELDSQSGLDHFEYTFDDVMGKYGDKVTNPTITNEATGSLTVYEETESTRSMLYLYVRAVDKAGNVGEWTANPAHANIDTVNPNAPGYTLVGNGTTTVIAKLTFTDGDSVRPSGFGKYIYTMDDGDEETITEHEINFEQNTTDSVLINTIKVWAVDKAGNVSATYTEFEINRKYIPTSYTYSYTGDYQIFTAPFDGTYTIEAAGAGAGGKGGIVKGDIELSQGDVLYVYVGKKFGNYFNSGASDIRLVSGTWSNITSLNSRIMVAGAGGELHTNDGNGGTHASTGYAGNGGGLTGGTGWTDVINSGGVVYCSSGYMVFVNGGVCRAASPYSSYYYKYAAATGGSQTSGGTGGKAYVGWGTTNVSLSKTAASGSFGRGGSNCSEDSCVDRYASGGGGYYGGGAGTGLDWSAGQNGGGGSSYISGYTGCTKHSSGKVFTNTSMKAGAYSGETGYVTINYIAT